MALIPFSRAVGALKDSDTSGGTNYYVGAVVNITDLNDVNIPLFSDRAGIVPLPQNGISNVTDAKGNFECFIAPGNYKVKSLGEEEEFDLKDAGNAIPPLTLLELVNADIEEGITIITSGYNSAGDGGKANYLIKTNSQAIADGDDLNALGGNVQMLNTNWAILDDESDTYVHPLKYGAVELADQTNLINYLLTKFRYKKLILLDAQYKISSTAGNSAIQVHEGEGLKGLKFNYFVTGNPITGNKSALIYEGVGDGIEIIHSNGTSSVQASVLEDVVIFDSLGTGNTGIVGDKMVAGRYSGATSGFNNGLMCSTWCYYTKMNFITYQFRRVGAGFGGNINSATINLQISSSETTVQDGLSIGDSSYFPSTQSTSNGAIIHCTSENTFGRNFFINLMRGGNLSLYSELGVIPVALTNLSGTNISLYVKANQTPARAVSVDKLRDCNIQGFIDGGNLFGLRVTNSIGVNLSGLQCSNIDTGDYSTGSIVGGTVATGDRLIREGWGRVGTRPSIGTWSRGSKLNYHNITVSGSRYNSGAVVTADGTEGVNNQTCSGTSGGNVLSVVNRSLYTVGDIIEITTIAGTFTMIGQGSGESIIVKPDFPSTFSGQTASYKAPSYAERFIDTV